MSAKKRIERKRVKGRKRASRLARTTGSAVFRVREDDIEPVGCVCRGVVNAAGCAGICLTPHTVAVMRIGTRLSNPSLGVIATVTLVEYESCWIIARCIERGKTVYEIAEGEYVFILPPND